MTNASGMIATLTHITNASGHLTARMASLPLTRTGKKREQKHKGGISHEHDLKPFIKSGYSGETSMVPAQRRNVRSYLSHFALPQCRQRLLSPRQIYDRVSSRD